jgi:hypothetical protein
VLPRFIPEAFIQGIQPIEYDFTFSGYFAPVPLFQAPGVENAACKELGSPALYQVAEYQKPLSTKISWDGALSVSTTGNCNAVRVILKNLLAILPTQNRSIAWHNQYLILPLLAPCTVTAGSTLNVKIEYTAGCEVEEFQSGITVTQPTRGMRLAESIEVLTTGPTVGTGNEVDAISTPRWKIPAHPTHKNKVPST